MDRGKESSTHASNGRRSADERIRQFCRGHPIGRRGYLRLLGAGTGIAAVGRVGTTTVGASSHYTTYTVDAGETFARNVGSDETFENVLIDITAQDAGIDIYAHGSNWTIRNVGIKGKCDSDSDNIFTLEVDDGATGTFENVYLADGATDGRCTGIFVPTTHEGTLRVRELNVQYWPDNGFYGSAAGRAERGGRGGFVEIARSYARNNGNANFRLGTDRSIVRDSVVHVDGGVPQLPNPDEARGVWVKEGGSVEIENTDILLESSDGSYCVWEGDDNSVGLARVIDSEVVARDGADGTYRGNVETVNVGSNPNVERPPGVPASAKEAALGRNLPKSIDVAGGSDTDEIEYVIETTGELAGTRSTEAGDAVSGNRATGATGGDDDIFRYSGALTTLDVDLPGDGSIASVTVDRADGRIEFAGGDRNSEELRYYVRVTGSLEPGSSIEGNDVYSADEAKGRLGGAFSDAYSYTGDVAALRVELGADTLSIELSTVD